MTPAHTNCTSRSESCARTAVSADAPGTIATCASGSISINSANDGHHIERVRVGGGHVETETDVHDVHNETLKGLGYAEISSEFSVTRLGETLEGTGVAEI